MEEFKGTTTFLVLGKDLNNGYQSRFVSFLKENGFASWGKHGFYAGGCGMYINLNTKIYAFGMPGIKITDTVCNHAITIDEFMTIFKIYKKYKDLPPLVMRKTVKKNQN